MGVPEEFYSSDMYAELTADITDENRQLAAGAMYIADEAIGNIVAELKRTNMYDNSVIVCASDNGGNPASGGNNWPLRGAKKTWFQGGVRVPGFVHSKLFDQARYGSVYHSLFHASDWVPTLCGGLAGFKLPDNLDGVDQWDALSNGIGSEDDMTSAPRTEILHNIDYIGADSGELISPASDSLAALSAFIDGTLYKVIINEDDDAPAPWYLPYSNEGSIEEADRAYVNQTSWLFNLDEDPFEQINLWEQVAFQPVKTALISKVCDYWETSMIDSLWRGDVTGNANKLMVSVYDANDGFITWWNETSPVNLTTQYPISALDSKGACPFYDFVGQGAAGPSGPAPM